MKICGWRLGCEVASKVTGQGKTPEPVLEPPEAGGGALCLEGVSANKGCADEKVLQCSTRGPYSVVTESMVSAVRLFGSESTLH